MTLTESLKIRKLASSAKKERLEVEKEEKKKTEKYDNGNDPKHHMGLSKSRIITNTLGYIVLIVISIVWLTPFVCLFFESFRCESTSPTGYIIPQQWGFDNYINLFTKTNFKKWFLNTLIVALFVSVFQTLFVLAMSYGLSRLRFKGRKFLMNFMLILGMFPGFLTLILLYKLLYSWHMTNENAIWGMIVVYVASSGMGYYISKGFFDTISKSLDEAARIDGASRFQIFYKVIMPLSKPIVIYTILTAFMGPWGDFIFAKYLSHATSDGMNVAVGLQNLISTDQSLNANYTMFCAGGIVVALPVTILFMFLQKYYVEGVTGGAVKG